MKFSEFLVEKNLNRSKIISREEAKDIIRNNCMDMAKKYVNEKQGIFRGIPKLADFLFADSKDITRKSANTKNYYTLLIDNSPKWIKYPKRSESFICSSVENQASGYGTVYLVLPFDTTEIAICPENDFWNSFDYNLSKTFKNFSYFSLNSFNDMLADIGNFFRISINDDNITSFKQSIQKLSETMNKSNFDKEEFLKRYKNYSIYNSEYHEFAEIIWKNKNYLYNFLLNFFEPKDFKLKTTKNFKAEKNKEIWFSGKAVFLRFNDYDNYNSKRTNVYSILKNIVEKG